MEDSPHNCTLLCFHHAERSWSPKGEGWGIARAHEKKESWFGLGTGGPAGVGGGTLVQAGQGSGSTGMAKCAVGFVLSRDGTGEFAQVLSCIPQSYKNLRSSLHTCNGCSS